MLAFPADVVSGVDMNEACEEMWRRSGSGLQSSRAEVGYLCMLECHVSLRDLNISSSGGCTHRCP